MTQIQNKSGQSLPAEEDERDKSPSHTEALTSTTFMIMMLTGNLFLPTIYVPSRIGFQFPPSSFGAASPQGPKPQKRRKGLPILVRLGKTELLPLRFGFIHRIWKRDSTSIPLPLPRPYL